MKVKNHPPTPGSPSLFLDRRESGPSIGGAILAPAHSSHVDGASAPASASPGSETAATFTLGDGSRFTFTRLADLHTQADV